MLIHIVRHAHAGDRSRWDRPDEDRPLSAKGHRQADALTEALLEAGIDTIWSSRYLRCRQTVEPLATRLGLEVTDEDFLAEGAWGTDALDALVTAAIAGRTVLACSHGDVIPVIVSAAVRRGAQLHGEAVPRKGDRYELTVRDATVISVHHVPRPDV